MLDGEDMQGVQSFDILLIDIFLLQMPKISAEKIRNNPDCFDAWEKVLSDLLMWLCLKCMHIHAWKKACMSNSRPADVIAGPLNGNGADFIIHGVVKPPYNASSSYATNTDSNPLDAPDAVLLTMEMLDRVMRKHITTIISIPPPCRLQFSQTLKAALDNVISKPMHLDAWLQLLLLPVCTLNLYVPKYSSEERSGNRRKLQVAAINQDFMLWNEPEGCFKLTQKLLGFSKPKPHHKPILKNKKNSNVEASRRKISHGNFSAAIRILSSNGVAPSTPDTLYELQQKHPPTPPPAIPIENISATTLSVDATLVLSAIKSFPKGTSCGREGLRDQHLLDAMSGPTAAIADDLLKSMAGVVNLWLSGQCPPILGEYVASAPLTPLLKPGGGLRSIAVGTIWRRLCSKLAATSVTKDMTEYLGTYQFGVGIPCGSEGIMHAANRLLEMKGCESNMTMLLIDFSNAFNLVDRSTLIKEVRAHCPSIARWVEFCYSTPARLYYNDNILSSATGVQQGDPLGPLLFALVLQLVAELIASQCTLDFHAWYLDDGTIACDTLGVVNALKILQEERPRRGQHLNISKTRVFWPTNDSRRDSPDVFPAQISKQSVVVKVLGGHVSLDL